MTAANALGSGPASSGSDPAVADGLAPTISAPSATLRSGLAITGVAVPVSVAWTATDATAGLVSTSLELDVSGGGFNPVTLSSATAKSWTGTLTADASVYQYRDSATDGAGNVAGPSTGTAFSLGIVQEAGAGTAKSGTWSTQTTSSALGGKLRYATAKGAYETFTFTGRGVAWVARKGTAEGSAAVYLDGKLVATVNLHATSTTMRWIAWQKSGLANGKHVVKIVCLGTSGHARVDVDAFIALK